MGPEGLREFPLRQEIAESRECGCKWREKDSITVSECANRNCYNIQYLLKSLIFHSLFVLFRYPVRLEMGVDLLLILQCL